MSETGGREDWRRFWRDVGLAWREVWRLVDRNPRLSLLIGLALAGIDEAASRLIEAMMAVYLFPRPPDFLAFAVVSLAIRIVLSIASSWLAYAIVFHGDPFQLATEASVKSRPAVRLLVWAALSWGVIVIGTNVLRDLVQKLLNFVWVALDSVPYPAVQWIAVISNMVVATLLTSGLAALMLGWMPGAVIRDDRHSWRRGSRSVLFASCFLLFGTTLLINEVLLLAWAIGSPRVGSITASLNSLLAVLLAFANYRRTQTTDPSVAHVFE